MRLNRRQTYLGLAIAILIVTVVAVVWQVHEAQTAKAPSVPVETRINPDKPNAKPRPKLSYIYAEPTQDFKSRAAKKLFGTYVKPGDSPVSPERFRGYHTGTDAEYGDIKADVPVRTIAAGQVVAAQYVDGYGGAVAVDSKIGNKSRIVIYGHLDPGRLPKVGQKLKQAEHFGYLGKAYSKQTDGERRHLHLAILRDDSLNWRGYVQSKSDLSAWLNPLTVLSEKSR